VSNDSTSAATDTSPAIWRGDKRASLAVLHTLVFSQKSSRFASNLVALIVSVGSLYNSCRLAQSALPATVGKNLVPRPRSDEPFPSVYETEMHSPRMAARIASRPILEILRKSPYIRITPT
jgi:hypothetical protein